MIKNQAGEYCPPPFKTLMTLSNSIRDDQKFLKQAAENTSTLVPVDAAMTIADMGCKHLNQPGQKVANNDPQPLNDLLAKFNIRL